jgi:hypothetical protein
MRLPTTALLLATFALTACSGTSKGTGTGTLLGGGAKSGFIDVDGGTCPDPSVGCEYTDPGTIVDGGKSSTAPAPSEYDPLFTAPASAAVTGNSLDGVWAGSMSNTQDDVRLVITPSAITIAVRCNSGHSVGPTTTIGTTVNAVTSSVSIRTLESKSVGTATCKIIVHPQTFARCSTGSGAPTCFDLVDTGLDFGPFELFSGDGTSSYGPAPAFSKLSDGT